jgi:hypothetical protein
MYLRTFTCKTRFFLEATSFSFETKFLNEKGLFADSLFPPPKTLTDRNDREDYYNVVL